MSTSTTQDVLSRGRLAAELFVTPQQIDRAAAAAGVKPAMRLDGVCYYAAQDAERIGRALRDGASRKPAPCK